MSQWKYVASALACMTLGWADDSAVLIQDLQGIALTDGSFEGNNDVVGIEYINLQIPGDLQQLSNELTTFLHQELTQETIQAIQNTVVKHYIAAAHPFVVVEVPPQEVTAGSIRILVSESRLSAIKVEGNKWVSSGTLLRYIHAKPGDTINQDRLIQNVSFINRHPFRRVDLVFAPGNEPDTTELILATKDRRPLRVYAGVDNTGVEPTGEWRWYTGFNWGNAFGLDHILSYQFTSAFNMHLFHAHTLEYLAPLSWGHVLNLYGGYSEVHPHMHGIIKRNDGWSTQGSLRYVMPLKIYAYLEHAITIGGDFKRSNNTFEFIDQLPKFGNCVNLTQAVLGYNGNYERNHFRLDFDGTLFWSPGAWIADQSDAAFNSLRPGAVNHWVYFHGSLAYLQRLPKAFSVFFLAEGQVSSEPLLPSEQFGLGGYNTVRGYEQRTVNKDDAVLLSLEARSPAMPITRWIKPSSKVSDGLQFLAFIDYGWGVNIKTLPGTDKADYLLGVGPGLRYTLDPYITARLDWGIRLHNKPYFGGSWSLLHVSVTGSF